MDVHVQCVYMYSYMHIVCVLLLLSVLNDARFSHKHMYIYKCMHVHVATHVCTYACTHTHAYTVYIHT